MAAPENDQNGKCCKCGHPPALRAEIDAAEQVTPLQVSVILGCIRMRKKPTPYGAGVLRAARGLSAYGACSTGALRQRELTTTLSMGSRLDDSSRRRGR
ncbi:hypothetical protein EASAB2608_05870 [Streptomyces sp. EAS-AB2608]|nr:hypothetical protein EASAB2608_05870 [Streptomyces sp. EAS-AB2608]